MVIAAVLSPYADILRIPGARAFVSAGFVGRMQMAMIGLGTVLLVRQATDSYGIAGAVGATIAVANAIGAPQIGRLVDRFGQHRVLLPAMAAHVAGIASLIAAAALDVPTAVYFLAAFLAGVAFPSFGSLVRSRWTNLLHGTERLQTAYALESVLDEIVFTFGPVLVTLLATTISPTVGLLTGAAFLIVGGLAFAAQRATEPPVVKTSKRVASAIRSRGLVVLALVLIGLGGVFGTIEVSMVAFAEEHGHEVATGPLLALHAISSALAGIAYGARVWRLSLQRRLQVALALLFVGTIPIALANTIPLMAVAIVVSGLTISPTLITSFALVEALVPRAALTEGFAWLSTSLGAGVAIGLAVAGHVVDATSGHRAFVVAIAASLLAAIAVLAGRRWLSPRPVAAAEPAAPAA
ncbi:MFS transporter [Conexibacter woesei]|uniref:Major facilitator superfamily MFS_1 n=1 Tax=Conexibacter woesei (strain DSM 14684 / CCUG 47730 / CIP 108061 / JCM 11494 / NBRC 100937 / ID131577) TaxID=469383 RepID=D3EZB9_CONWI|nr:MFS transporter [Conexibacter woesei]ADB51884.1 major facilitator superfamily MFS_1 [Conexibacter woesei DSM 14684]